MKGFEQYNLYGWVEDGLSIHPKLTLPTPAQRRPVREYLAKVAVPVMAIATFGMSGATVARMVGDATIQTPQLVRDQVVVAAQPSTVPLLPSSMSATASIIDLFEVQTEALLEEVESGHVVASADTLRLAADTARRHADTDSSGQPDWVEEVARQTAQLDD